MNQNESLAIIKEDPWMAPYEQDVNERFSRYLKALHEIEAESGSLLNFAQGHHYYGINFDPTKNGWFYREWAPAAEELYLTGDFNGWDRTSHPLKKINRATGKYFCLTKQIKNPLFMAAK